MLLVLALALTLASSVAGLRCDDDGCPCPSQGCAATCAACPCCQPQAGISAPLLVEPGCEAAQALVPVEEAPRFSAPRGIFHVPKLA